MQETIINFANNRNSGLCLIDMPTGTGKTYNTIELFKRYINGEILNDVDLLVYVTPLKKNIAETYDKLRKAINNDEVFNKNVIRVYSNDESFKNYYFSKNKKGYIPSSILSLESYQNLIEECDEYNREGAKKERLDKKIREELEPKFRKDLEDTLSKIASDTKNKNEILDGEFAFIKEMYPACLLDEKKIVFISMSKFIYPIDPIISKKFEFLTYERINNSLIFIDEFDATKSFVLEKQINDCKGPEIDLYDLFSEIVARLNNNQLTTKILKTKDLKKAYEEMAKFIEDNKNKFNLQYSFKLDETSDVGEVYLFNDDEMYPIIDAKYKHTYLYVKLDRKDNIQIIKIGEKDKRDGRGLYEYINAMINSINKFINCCSWLAINYYNNHNKFSINKIEMENAVATILKPLISEGLNREFLFNCILNKILLKETVNDKDDYKIYDFYRNGFNFYRFYNENNNDSQTTIKTVFLNETPEKYLLSLIAVARVVGLSATETIEDVIGNYNLKYIENKKPDAIYKIPNEDKGRVDAMINSHLEGKYKINVDVIKNSIDEERNKFLDNLLIDGAKKERIENDLNYKFSNNRDDEFSFGRFKKEINAIQKFINNKDSKVLLVLTNKKTTEDDLSFAKDLVDGIAEKSNVEVPICYNLLSKNFEDTKKEFQNTLKDGKRVILFSCYQTVSTGQNLQYEMLNDENISEEVDIDSIYLEYPRNIIVDCRKLKGDDGNLIEYIYQIESLVRNEEIKKSEGKDAIKSAFKEMMNINARIPKSGKAYDSKSVNNCNIKILMQAVGRLNRTKKKNKRDVNIYVDEEIMNELDFKVVDGKKMINEFSELIKRWKKHKEENGEILDINNANIIVGKRIDIMANNIAHHCTDSDRELWNLMREVTLKYPTISKEDYEKLISEEKYKPLKDFWFYANGEKINSYLVSGEEDDLKIRLGNSNNKQRDENLIDSSFTRLDVVMTSNIVKKYFEKSGYKTSFEPHEYMLLPAVIQRIYKGAVGEQTVKAFFENYKINLNEIKDNSKFEKFDFYWKDIYFDVKNWSENDKQERNEYFKKFNNKLKMVGGKKAFLISLVSSSKHRIRASKNSDIIEVFSLFEYKDNKYQPISEEDMKKIIDRVKKEEEAK